MPIALRISFSFFAPFLIVFSQVIHVDRKLLNALFALIDVSISSSFSPRRSSLAFTSLKRSFIKLVMTSRSLGMKNVNAKLAIVAAACTARRALPTMEAYLESLVCFVSSSAAVVSLDLSLRSLMSSINVFISSCAISVACWAVSMATVAWCCWVGSNSEVLEQLSQETHSAAKYHPTRRLISENLSNDYETAKIKDCEGERFTCKVTGTLRPTGADGNENVEKQKV